MGFRGRWSCLSGAMRMTNCRSHLQDWQIEKADLGQGVEVDRVLGGNGAICSFHLPLFSLRWSHGPRKLSNLSLESSMSHHLCPWFYGCFRPILISCIVFFITFHGVALPPQLGGMWRGSNKNYHKKGNINWNGITSETSKQKIASKWFMTFPALSQYHTAWKPLIKHLYSLICSIRPSSTCTQLERWRPCMEQRWASSQNPSKNASLPLLPGHPNSSIQEPQRHS